jgi:hypothetical protein
MLILMFCVILDDAAKAVRDAVLAHTTAPDLSATNEEWLVWIIGEILTDGSFVSLTKCKSPRLPMNQPNVLRN